MKLDIVIRDLCEIHYDKQPMSKERFEMLAWLVGALGLAAIVVFGFTAHIIF